MSFYIRFIATDKKTVTLPLLVKALKEMDAAYAIAKSGELKHGKEVYGVVEINRPGDGLFDEEIEELKEFASEARGKGRAQVLKTLEDATFIVAVQVLFADRGDRATLAKVNPLFEWLIENRKGLAQVDDDGYYTFGGRLLKVQ